MISFVADSKKHSTSHLIKYPAPGWVCPAADEEMQESAEHRGGLELSLQLARKQRQLRLTFQESVGILPSLTTHPPAWDNSTDC